uniref:Pentatricopeptide repeat-containing protein At3g24000, mitochondrial-like n=1 Tax=Elaeis guineensis var. tenera TaxID=51953 RepID=A0A6I9R1U0_ELAGV|nr:pentatricopeptide repeat-containing protein At3g24000, mitochondrial-like [Elaeis guineensis]
MSPCAIPFPSPSNHSSLSISPTPSRSKALLPLNLSPIRSSNTHTTGDGNHERRRKATPIDPLVHPPPTPFDASRAQLDTGATKSSLAGEAGVSFRRQECGGAASFASTALQFDGMPHRKAPLYASMIASHGRSRRWEDVLFVFVQMLRDGAMPDKFLLPKILKACSELRNLRMGAAVHGYMVRTRLELDVFIGNSFIDMYAKSGDLASSRAVFDRMPEKDVVSWTALVNAYADAGLLDEASQVFESMRANGIAPDLISWNALISGFARNGEIDVALHLFEEMTANGPKPGANSWNGVISGSVQNGRLEDALEVFRGMCLHENPNAVTVASILPACSGLEALNLGKELHSYVIKKGIQINVFVGGSLIDMYRKCGKFEYAERLFLVLENKNATVWNEMIAAYANEDRMSEALELFRSMQEDGLKPDVITYNTLLAAYARKGQKDEIFRMLSEMSDMGLKPNVISMNALVSGFHHSGLTVEALELFRAMQLPAMPNLKNYEHPINMLRLSIQPNSVTITSVLSVCAGLELHNLGKEIHGYVLRNCFESNIFVSSALVDMYAKCEDMTSATKVFHEIRDKNTVSWNILMAGHNHSGEPEAALKLFPEMLEQNFLPSSITLMILLLACSNAAALRLGRELHGYIEKNRPDGYPVILASALIDMYAKCGSIADARLIFDCISQKDLAVWNTMMAGYLLHRMARDTVALFNEMEQSGIKPDHVTFTAVLSACNQEGFQDEGWKYFRIMEDVHGVAPTLEHFTCMVDIMGTAGLLEKSVNLITRMPFEPDACVWSTLLKACRLHSNYEIGQRAASALFELEPTNASNYIVLSNIFAMAGMWDSAMYIRNSMRDRGLRMVNACSWIHIGRRVHSFKAGDRSHPEIDKILDVWNKFAGKMRRAGYVPQDVMFCDDGKIDPFACYHTEKLAVCLGIISLHTRCQIRVLKNVRMCVDCHASIKFISEIDGRDILVKDGRLYHHFKDGMCSCREKW